MTRVPWPHSLLSTPSNKKLLSKACRPFTAMAMPGRALSVVPRLAPVFAEPTLAPGPRYAS